MSFENDHKAHYIYSVHLRPNAMDIEAAVAAGMIRKADLVDGATYEGHCRNAGEAVWHAEKQRFTYMRTKWYDTFPEDIVHPEDDEKFDIFVPVKRIDTEV